jgi:hypothetical protein
VPAEHHQGITQLNTNAICRLLLTALALLQAGCIFSNTPADLKFQSVHVCMNRALSRPELEVSFTSSVDLVQFTSSHSFNIGNSVVACDDNWTNLFLSNSFVYYRGNALLNFRPDPMKATMHGNTPITYQIFIGITRSQGVFAGTPLNAIDLRRKPDDVCFMLRGGNELGGYRSNVVRVPKEQIVAALANP